MRIITKMPKKLEEKWSLVNNTNEHEHVTFYEWNETSLKKNRNRENKRT